MSKAFTVYSSLEEGRCYFVFGIDESPLRLSEIITRQTSFNCLTFAKKDCFFVGEQIFWDCVVFELELKKDIKLPFSFPIETLLLREIMDVLKEFIKFICKDHLC